jgi:hypothetical protein
MAYYVMNDDNVVLEGPFSDRDDANEFAQFVELVSPGVACSVVEVDESTDEASRRTTDAHQHKT